MQFLILGIISIVIGLAIRYIINRRRFYRRNVAGLETFSSYEKSVVTNILEHIGRLIAFVLIIFGAFLLLVHYTSPKKDKQSPQTTITSTTSVKINEVTPFKK